uniref:Gem nuclear organelle associated protein 4 n=1 Tax=Anolis carolinensis TaxID=28377 RepID=H9GMU7_ANOCA|nr:PREDICTED: gem-associated protein 4 [Anolis carolinensis]|eukprot:XP_003229803.1 PREDICTED: gem-associated protein 4 [Anolis carolinensis]
MQLGPLTICGEVTILHGGFLLASQLCHPRPLSELAKSDWPLVGKPIMEALEEICTSHSSYPPQPDAWKKKAAVILWSKVLFSEAPAVSLNQRWKDDAFFSVSNMIPEINRTVLFELFMAANAPQLFTELLLVLPEPLCRRELEALVEYVAKETSQRDVRFYLDVWWEIMKHKAGQEDRLTLLFRSVSHQCLPEPDDVGQPPKRFKSDGPPSAHSSPETSVLPILADGLKLIWRSVSPAKMKCYALANLLDVLSISIAACDADSLPIQTYLVKVSSVVTLWSNDCDNCYGKTELDEKVKEAERSVSLLSVAQASKALLLVDLGFLRTLLEEWSPELQGFLNDPEHVCYESYRLLDCLALLEKRLARYAESGDLEEETAKAMVGLSTLVADFLKSISLKPCSKECKMDIVASVAMVIINKRMDRHAEVCSVFAAEKDWALTEGWAACLEKNKELFREPGTILKLVQTLADGSKDAKSQGQAARVAKVILECYTALPLTDQNKVISGVLATWGRKGLSGASPAFSEGFQEELNVAFNQIIQSVSGEGFQRVVAAVSRLVALNPEATIKKIYNLVVSNLGTHLFLAEILCCFPALRFQEGQDSMDLSVTLLLACLRETVFDRLVCAKEKEQFLEFLGYLLQPNGANPLFSPAEVTQSLVLPFLKSDSPCVELCLRILDQALKVPSEPDWIHACHPFPLVLSLCKFLDGFAQYWHEPEARHTCSFETKDLVAANLARLCDALSAQKDSLSPALWDQSVSWLHRKAGALDWTIGLRLESVYGEHFKKEVPSTLFEVCKLPEEEWTSRSDGQYGAGSGLLAWMECCCVSTALREKMLVLLTVNIDNPEEVNLFSKGFLVALVQVFPWCSQSEWRHLIHVIKSLLEREVLYVPYSLEYVPFLPLLDFRPFAFHLQLSVLLLRAFQFLCGSSGAGWMPSVAWKHLSRLYCLSISDLLGSAKEVARGTWRTEDPRNGVRRELSFTYIQIFCHVLHVAAMLPEEATAEALLVLSLEVLSQYEVLYEADESLGSSLRKANERHFLESIAENVTNKEVRTMLLQKLRKL